MLPSSEIDQHVWQPTFNSCFVNEVCHWGTILVEQTYPLLLSRWNWIIFWTSVKHLTGLQDLRRYCNGCGRSLLERSFSWFDWIITPHVETGQRNQNDFPLSFFLVCWAYPFIHWIQKLCRQTTLATLEGVTLGGLAVHRHPSQCGTLLSGFLEAILNSIKPW